jgi:hypothetical protein
VTSIEQQRWRGQTGRGRLVYRIQVSQTRFIDGAASWPAGIWLPACCGPGDGQPRSRPPSSRSKPAFDGSPEGDSSCISRLWGAGARDGVGDGTSEDWQSGKESRKFLREGGNLILGLLGKSFAQQGPPPSGRSHELPQTRANDSRRNCREKTRKRGMVTLQSTSALP